MLDAVCGTCAHARVRGVCPCAQPFWPEGLGVNRGIHNALDACWIAHKWAIASASASGSASDIADEGERDEVRAERQYLYSRYTAPLSGKNRGGLVPDEPVYFADPESRYVGFQDRALRDYARQARLARQRQQQAVRERTPMRRSSSFGR